MLKESLDLQEKILNRLQFLKTEGAASELQYLEQLNRVSETNGRLNQAKVERFRQQAVQNQKIQQLKADLQDLESRITESSVICDIRHFGHLLTVLYLIYSHVAKAM